MARFRVPISDSEVDRLLAIPGVNGVGEGMENGQRVIVVSVEDRDTANDPRIPDMIEGFPVFVEVVGGVGLASAGLPIAPGEDLPRPTSARFASPRRPVPPGVSIGHTEITAGTSSFLATDGDAVFQMGNSHVLALYGEADPGDQILQPGPTDGGVVDEDNVGVLAGDVDIGETGNRVDLAWYRPDADVTTVIEELGEPNKKPTDPAVGDDVIFVGRTSGVQRATVDRVNFTIQVGEQRRQFVDQFRIDKPLIPGDSGAPIVREAQDGSLIPLGIGFAATDNLGFANPISSVVEESGMDIIMPSDSEGGDAGGSGGIDRSSLALVAGAAGVALLSGND